MNFAQKSLFCLSFQIYVHKTFHSILLLFLNLLHLWLSCSFLTVFTWISVLIFTSFDNYLFFQLTNFWLLSLSLFLFLDREDGWEKERERNINVWLPLTHPLLGTWPATQACALTANWIGDPLVRRLAFNPLSHTSQGWLCYLLNFMLFFNFLFVVITFIKSLFLLLFFFRH